MKLFVIAQPLLTPADARQMAAAPRADKAEQPKGEPRAAETTAKVENKLDDLFRGFSFKPSNGKFYENGGERGKALNKPSGNAGRQQCATAFLDMADYGLVYMANVYKVYNGGKDEKPVIEVTWPSGGRGKGATLSASTPQAVRNLERWATRLAREYIVYHKANKATRSADTDESLVLDEDE